MKCKSASFLKIALDMHVQQVSAIEIKESVSCMCRSNEKHISASIFSSLESRRNATFIIRSIRTLYVLDLKSSAGVMSIDHIHATLHKHI